MKMQALNMESIEQARDNIILHSSWIWAVASCCCVIPSDTSGAIVWDNSRGVKESQSSWGWRAALESQTPLSNRATLSGLPKDRVLIVFWVSLTWACRLWERLLQFRALLTTTVSLYTDLPLYQLLPTAACPFRDTSRNNLGWSSSHPRVRHLNTEKIPFWSPVWSPWHPREGYWKVAVPADSWDHPEHSSIPGAALAHLKLRAFCSHNLYCLSGFWLKNFYYFDS